MSPAAFTDTEVARHRAATPGCEALIHFDNAGAALQPAPVIAAVSAHLTREQAFGGYAAEDDAEAEIEGLYASAARLLNCAPGEIAVVENATRAWDMAFYGLDFDPGDRILTSSAEYASNYMAFQQARRRFGVEIDVARPEPDGSLTAESFARLIEPHTRLISLTHVPSQSGAVAPAAEIGALARAHGVPLLLDACQSAGQLPLDVTELGCDMLSLTSRKFLRGPRGVGLLYVRQGFLERLDPPFVDLRAATWTGPESFTLRPDARRFETWEGFVAGRLGLKAAIDYALEIGLDRIAARVGTLAADLRQALAKTPGVTLRDPGGPLSGIVTFSHDRVAARDLQQALRRSGVNVTAISPPTAQLDFAARGLPPLVRASVHYYNTAEEIGRFRQLVEEAAACA